MSTTEAFCILAAGRGSRLGKYSRSMSKALLPVNGKAVISHVVDKAHCDIVVAVGYDAKKVIEYCSAAHPGKNIKYVTVDNFDGPGSGPAYSLNRCRDLLQRPFTLSTADCIVGEEYPAPEDWVGVAPTNDPASFCTFDVEGGRVVGVANKRADGFPTAFIGLCGIRSYQKFWGRLGQELVDAFEGWDIATKGFTWFDTGTVDNYHSTRGHFESGYDFGKADECTYFVGDKVVKLFAESPKAKSRIDRCDLLKQAAPLLTYRGDNVFAYARVSGETLYNSPRGGLLTPLLGWCDQHLWGERQNPEFREWCLKFYRDKTLARLSLYESRHGKDSERVINGIPCEPMAAQVRKVNWPDLCEGRCVLFHGDLQFDNIIYNGSFTIIDWRESFAGSNYGDLYYDLAKMYGGIVLPYANIKKGLFEFHEDGDQIEYSYARLPDEATLVSDLREWVSGNGYSWGRVKTLAALIYLNMAPLHKTPFDKLLFNHSKLLMETND